MKYLLNALSHLFIFVTPALAQINNSQEYNKVGQDTVAFSVIEGNLTIVKNFIENKTNPNTLEIGNVIAFLLDLTSIPPESFFDNSKMPYSPSKNDYDRWYTWYMLNKQYIGWDSKEMRIIIKKTIRPYIPRSP